MGPCFRRDDGRFYCAFGLIAQDTFTDTESVSSPCATGAPAAIGAAILPRNIGAGAPSSEMLSGSPSVTPAALAKISALRRASATAFSRASSRCLDGCETVKVDAADIVGAGAHQHVDHIGDLGDVAQPDRHAVAGAIAGYRRGARAVRRILRLQRQPRGLGVLFLDAGALQRQQHLAHRRIVGLGRLARGLGVGGHAAVDLRLIRRPPTRWPRR